MKITSVHCLDIRQSADSSDKNITVRVNFTFIEDGKEDDEIISVFVNLPIKDGNCTINDINRDAIDRAHGILNTLGAVPCSELQQAHLSRKAPDLFQVQNMNVDVEDHQF